jgi:hypothetical protein
MGKVNITNIDVRDPSFRRILDAASKLPPNITVSTAFLGNRDKQVKRLFRYILADYRHRFNVDYADKKFHVAICGITPVQEKDYSAVTDMDHTGDDNPEPSRILVQVDDPFISVQTKDIAKMHEYVHYVFHVNLCHEFVHVAQNLAATKKTWKVYPHNKKDPIERYFFDKHEIEARVLEQFYYHKYAFPIFEYFLETGEE